MESKSLELTSGLHIYTETKTVFIYPRLYKISRQEGEGGFLL